MFTSKRILSIEVVVVMNHMTMNTMRKYWETIKIIIVLVVIDHVMKIETTRPKEEGYHS